MVRQRLKLLTILLLLPFGLIVWRLQALQLVPTTVAENRRNSEHRTHAFTTPRRGRILDRNGVVLAGNRPVLQLRFNYALLNPRSAYIEILVEELQKTGDFPRPHEVEANLLEISSLREQLARSDEDLLAPADSTLDNWLLLVSGLGPPLATRLERRWSSLQALLGRGLPRLFELRPEADGKSSAVWFHQGRVLAFEMALERLVRLFRRVPGSRQGLDLRGRVEEVLADIEKVVQAEVRRDRAEGSGALQGEIIKKERNTRRHQRRQSWLLVSDVPLTVVTEIEYYPELYPGIECVDSVEREYPLAEACGTITGWLGRLEARADDPETLGAAERHLKSPSKYESAEDFRKARKGKLRPTDWIGTMGLEAKYDEKLRGLAGWTVARRDSQGRARRRLAEVLPEDGGDVRTTLDADLQKVLYEALAQRVQPECVLGGGTAGSAVVMDLPSGALLASVGFPGVNPNRVRESGYRQELKKLWDPQTDGWWYDRPSSLPLFPGSVFKIVVAAAAMESSQDWEGPFSESRRYPCHHEFDLVKTLHCSADYGHTESRSVNVAEALQFSCNNYFYYLGLKHLGVQLLEPWAYKFGYGRSTGVDLPTTRFDAGRLASSDQLASRDRATLPWKTCHYAIGQVFVEATPLQVLRSYAALALGGEQLPRPYLFTKSTPDPLRLGNPRTAAVIRDGLWRAGHAANGTAADPGVNLARFNAAYKTGTAEVRITPPKLNNGWLAGWAPFDNPRIAFVAVIERTPLHGVNAAGPVVAKILEHFAAQEPELYLLSTEKNP